MPASRHGLSVIQGDADSDLEAFPDGAFDVVVLSQTLQATRQPRQVLEELLRIGKRAIVSFPNFGFWRIRLSLLFRGRMPVTELLHNPWYDTPNIHLCTIRDFVALCDEIGAPHRAQPDPRPARPPVRARPARQPRQPVGRAGRVRALGRPLMLVAQISDTHILAPGKLFRARIATPTPGTDSVYAEIDTGACLARAVAAINRVGDRCPTSRSSPAIWSTMASPPNTTTLRQLLAPLRMPVFVIPGNHDSRAPLRAAFGADGYLPATGSCTTRSRIIRCVSSPSTPRSPAKTAGRCARSGSAGSTGRSRRRPVGQRWS